MANADALAEAASERTSLLITALRQLDDEVLHGASELDGWSRLTIVCHLRYGTVAALRMTTDTQSGRATSYYPHGRSRQRPATLLPAPHEQPRDVLDDWEQASAALTQTWSGLAPEEWALEVVEPADNPDLGTIPLARLALARLTEVDVHGVDLAIDAPDWSDLLVSVGLPTRLGWLATRRTNHRPFARSISGSWLLDATDGPTWFIAVDGDRVTSRPAHPDDEPTATITGSSRDLFALLLGRPRHRSLILGGDTHVAAAFSDAFPGP